MPKKGSARRPSSDASNATATEGLARYAHAPKLGGLAFSQLPQGEEERVWQPCSALLAIPKCANDFAEALSRCSDGKRRGTAEAYVDSLEDGFIEFCRRKKIDRKILPKDIDTKLLNCFVTWLSRKRRNGTYLYTYWTRIHYLSVIRKVMRELEGMSVTLADDRSIPVSPWPKAYESSASQSKEDPKDYSSGDVLRFYRYCVNAITETMRTVEVAWAEEEAYLQATEAQRRTAELGSPINRGEVVFKAKKTFGVALPERQSLRASGHPLYISIERYGYKNLATAIGPYAAALCPFVYYLLFVTGFNLQSVVDIRVADLLKTTSLGRTVIRVRSVKHRAKSKRKPHGKPVRAVFVIGEDKISPGPILDFLLKWTAYLRKTSPDPRTEWIFTYIPRNRSKAGTLATYAQQGKRKSVFDRHTTAFCRAGGFRWTGSRKIRNVAAEIVDDMNGGDTRATAAYLHHSQESTTREHYQNPGVLARQARRLAQGMTEHRRWIQSQGRVEPRNRHIEHDRSAATPGFSCLDPMQSPIPGQRKGCICVAYGECPSCALANVNLHNSYAAACLYQLRRVFENKRISIGKVGFATRWGKSYRALMRKWLPAFPDEVVEMAKKVGIPSLPDLE